MDELKASQATKEDTEDIIKKHDVLRAETTAGFAGVERSFARVDQNIAQVKTTLQKNIESSRTGLQSQLDVVIRNATNFRKETNDSIMTLQKSLDNLNTNVGRIAAVLEGLFNVEIPLDPPPAPVVAVVERRLQGQKEHEQGREASFTAFGDCPTSSPPPVLRPRGGRIARRGSVNSDPIADSRVADRAG